MTTTDHTSSQAELSEFERVPLDKENVERLWPQVIVKLCVDHPAIFTFMRHSCVVSVSDGVVEIGLDRDFGVTMMSREEPRSTVEETVGWVTGGQAVRAVFTKSAVLLPPASWMPKSLLDVDEDRKAKRVEAFDAEVALRPQLREVVHEYRAMLDKHEYGFCPVCGQRTAIKSNGDLGVGPTIQIYCNSGDCPAREIDVTVKRGFMWRPLEWDSQPSKQTTSRQRVAEEKKRRPNQHVWRKMWRARHGGTLICNLCGVTETDAQIQIDHIVELRDGGEDADWNTQPLCVDCHRRKTSARSRR